MKLLVGLGNPGSQFEQTRHNAGFRVVTAFAAKQGLTWETWREQALITQGNWKQEPILLTKPLLAMNESGVVVAAFVQAYALTPEQVVVIFDDLDLPLGVLRLRERGGAGGHRGFSHILSLLGTRQVPRLRIGVGHPSTTEKKIVRPYVTAVPSKQGRLVLEQAEARAVVALELLLEHGISHAMNLINPSLLSRKHDFKRA